ncbi:MAG: RdgB/HAM1 family non-canonical purine NTP pyrophosphatase [Clostridia bacterium]|nr:RdgB/HAM1 family non-canonical purine NTP pyrophosphatase [Clostridia bacterium]
MQKIIAATKNKNKVREFKEILPDFDIITQEEAGIDLDVEETGTTFMENALLKAKAIFEKTKIPSLADDSGLEVYALDGAPGVYSARYGGEGLDDKGRTKLLLENMKDIKDEDRGARFVSAIVFVTKDRVYEAEGVFEGVIAHEMKGANGFGYDPVFYVPEMGKTAAEMTPDEKNSMSHRGKALRALAEMVKN